MSQPPVKEEGPNRPEKMRGLNRGDLQTTFKQIDLSETPTPWIKYQNGAGEIKDKK